MKNSHKEEFRYGKFRGHTESFKDGILYIILSKIYHLVHRK